MRVSCYLYNFPPICFAEPVRSEILVAFSPVNILPLGDALITVPDSSPLLPSGNNADAGGNQFYHYRSSGPVSTSRLALSPLIPEARYLGNLLPVDHRLEVLAFAGRQAVLHASAPATSSRGSRLAMANLSPCGQT